MRAFLKKFLVDLFTGPDGETIAIGRVYTVPVLITGLVLLAHTGWGAQPPMTMTEMGIGLGGVAASVTALLAIPNHIDNPVPKGD